MLTTQAIVVLIPVWLCIHCFLIVFCPLVVFPLLERFVLQFGHGNDSNNALSIHHLAWVATIITTARQLEQYSPLFVPSASEQGEQQSTLASKLSLVFGGSIFNTVEFLLPLAALAYSLAPLANLMMKFGGPEEVNLGEQIHFMRS